MFMRSDDDGAGRLAVAMSTGEKLRVPPANDSKAAGLSSAEAVAGGAGAIDPLVLKSKGLVAVSAAVGASSAENMPSLKPCWGGGGASEAACL